MLSNQMDQNAHVSRILPAQVHVPLARVGTLRYYIHTTTG